MKRQVISLFFLFIISFQAFPIKSFFNVGEIEISQDISEDEVEKSEAKSKKIETCHSFFLDHLDITYTTTAIYILNVKNILHNFVNIHKFLLHKTFTCIANV